MANYEIEIKTLLGSKEKADDLVTKMKADPDFISRGSHKQLNHYFMEGDLELLKKKLEPHLEKEKKEQFDSIITHAKDFSVRTRWADGTVLFVIKATVDDTSSSNGTARQEFESPVNLSLEELDKLLLECKFLYQAKWSRERQDYSYRGMNVSIDKNAGYGYLAEFEAIINNPDLAEGVKEQIRGFMKELGVDELKQDRLARMFDYYNQNWQDYYGTEKTFNIE